MVSLGHSELPDESFDMSGIIKTLEELEMWLLLLSIITVTLYNIQQQ